MGKNIEIDKVRCSSQIGKGREYVTRIEGDTLVRRRTRARLGQVGRATQSEAETIATRSACATQSQQQASIPT